MKFTSFLKRKTNSSTKTLPNNGMNFPRKHHDQKKVSFLFFICVVLFTNALTILLAGSPAPQTIPPKNWSKLYPEHQEMLMSLKLKTPYEEGKKVVLTNTKHENKNSSYFSNIILIKSPNHSPDNAQGFSLGVEENTNIYHILVPKNKLSEIQKHDQLTALPNHVPNIKVQKTRKIQKRVGYEVIY